MEIYGVKSSNSNITWTETLNLGYFCEVFSIKYHKQKQYVNWSFSFTTNTEIKKWPAHNVIHKYRAPRLKLTTVVSPFTTLKGEDIKLSLSKG